MDQATHYYLVFETADGFCGIAWNSAGITRFQLPTRSPEATKRILLRRAPGAKPGTPTPNVAEVIAAVKRYFEGEETDFSGFKLDLGAQDYHYDARISAWQSRLSPTPTRRNSPTRRNEHWAGVFLPVPVGIG